METRSELWGRGRFLTLRGESADGSLDSLIEEFVRTLAQHGLTLDDAVFHRFWTSTRERRDRLREPRERLLGGARKTATSSFISAGHILSGGALAMEMIAFKARDRGSRRLVEFAPPRAYAHYLVQDEWLFLSGMAEDAPTMDAQFDAAFAQAERALAAEKVDWSAVRDATLFLERGAADLAWLEDRFRRAVLQAPPRISFELVDGLASVEKKLEIEVIAELAD